MKEESKKKRSEKVETPIELLRQMPKAMQVGPQPHLRKGWGQDSKFKLLGGTEKRNDGSDIQGDN